MQISIKKQLVIFILFYHVLQITKKVLILLSSLFSFIYIYICFVRFQILHRSLCLYSCHVYLIVSFPWGLSTTMWKRKYENQRESRIAREKSYQIRWSDRQHVLSWWIRWTSDLTFSPKNKRVYCENVSFLLAFLKLEAVGDGWGGVGQKKLATWIEDKTHFYF